MDLRCQRERWLPITPVCGVIRGTTDSAEVLITTEVAVVGRVVEVCIRVVWFHYLAEKGCYYVVGLHEKDSKEIGQENDRCCHNMCKASGIRVSDN